MTGRRLWPRRNSGASHVLAAGVGVASQGISRLVTNVLIGRLAGANALGTYATVMSVGMLLASLWPASVGSTGAKFLAQARGRGDPDGVGGIQGHLVRRVLVSSVLIGTMGALAWRAATSAPWAETLMVGVVVLALGTSALARGVLYGARRTLFCSVWELGTAVLALVLVTIMLLGGIRDIWLVVPTVIGMLVLAAAGWPRHVSRATPRLRREMDQFTGVAALGNLASNGFLQLSVVVSSFLSAESAGQFAVAVAVCTPLTLAVAPLGLALFPAINESYGRGDLAAVRRQVDLATRFVTYVLLGGAGVLVLLREPIISIVWGPDFAAAAPITVFLLAAAVLGAVAIPSNNSMASQSQRDASIATGAAVVGLIVGSVCWLFLVPTLGLVGIAGGYLVGRIIFVTAVMERVWRGHQLRWNGFVARILLLAILLAVLDLVVSEPVLAAVVFSAAVGTVAASDRRLLRLLGGERT